MKTLLVILLVAVVLFLLMTRMGRGYAPPKTLVSPAFVAACNPGHIPASYTASGGDCVPYYF